MRAAIVPTFAMSCALAALLASPGLAQTTPAPQVGPAQTPPAQSSPAQSSPAQSSPAKPAGRVGSLSPDEQRRAARGRDRAAAAEKAAREQAEAKLAARKPAQDEPAQDKTAQDKTVQDKPAQPTPATARTAPVETPHVAATPEVATHRSVDVSEPARTEPVRSQPARAVAAEIPRAHPHAERVRRTARLHHRAWRFAADYPRLGDRVPDEVPLRPLPGDFRRDPPRAPYERVVEDVRPAYPGFWGAPRPLPPYAYRPAFPPQPYYPYPARAMMVP